MSTETEDKKLNEFIEQHAPACVRYCEASCGLLRVEFGVKGEEEKIILRAEYKTGIVNVLSLAADCLPETTLPKFYAFRNAMGAAEGLAAYLTGLDLNAPEQAGEFLETVVNQHVRYVHDPECTVSEIMQTLREEGWPVDPKPCDCEDKDECYCDDEECGEPDYAAIRAGIARVGGPVIVAFPKFGPETALFVHPDGTQLVKRS